MTESHILNSLFVDNKAGFGGSILIKDIVTNNNEIINCTFINSTTIKGLAETQLVGKGGAIFVRDWGILVANSTFIDCNATEEEQSSGMVVQTTIKILLMIYTIKIILIIKTIMLVTMVLYLIPHLLTIMLLGVVLSAGQL